MSVDSSENIKALIEKVVKPERKLTMYHSKYSSGVRKEVQRRKLCHQTMGYANIRVESPHQYLKKHTRIVRRPCVDKTRPALERKAPVPSFKIKTKTNRTEKNFKQQNIVHVVKTAPKKPDPVVAHTVDGCTQKLIPSGLLPHFIFKEDYGKIPEYLEERQRLTEVKERKMRGKHLKKSSVRYVTEDERQELLVGLKKNWEDLQKEFQLLPMVTDTLPKIKRKTLLEKELKDLEKDIELVERNPVIYVDECKRNKLKNRERASNAHSHPE